MLGRYLGKVGARIFFAVDNSQGLIEGLSICRSWVILRESLGGPGRCLVCTWRGLARPFESVLEVLRGPWRVLGRSQGVLGRGLGGSQNRRGFLGGSREGPGGVLG